MAVLSVKLPPFSPDYSGVSATLFDLNTVTAMHDASGCTGNYTGYDEPRWYGSKSGIFCSGLRELDAVLGDDEKLIQKMLVGAKELAPDLMALVGSPVPMVIGSDLVGVAKELESRSDIPCFGFDMTGTRYYDYGAAAAGIALLKRFAEETATIAHSVNILGATPMDFATGENLVAFQDLLAERKIPVVLTLAMGYTLEDLKKARSAELNLAISKTGLMIARYMEKEFGISYLCGLPVGVEGMELYFHALKKVKETKESMILKGSNSSKPEVLIVGEQVQSNGMRIALEQKYQMTVAVGCIFGKEEALAQNQDINLFSELEISKAINDPQYKVVIGDPFVGELLKSSTQCKFIPCAQYAVSSKLGMEYQMPIIGTQFQEIFK